ncbi:glycogen synthase [Candidatus Similichlamydia epinepheli]|uniref:glycogen synthase n=1 Tax=Candidatus Similichlamydia epinepheli TaxID=1903953 RepID=UPI000D36A99F|nr:glycogen/starch synthase [Candidatus Similichlamydia epinepheli]
MKILHVSSELYPICKVGGLGDVVRALAKEQASHGNEVLIAIPYYSFMEEKQFSFFHSIKLCKWELNLEAWSGEQDGCRLILIRDLAPSKFFDRRVIYGEHDDTSRFCCFITGIMHLLMQRRDLIPDVIHLHDWPASYAALFKHIGELSRIRFVFTLHNPEGQGVIDLSTLNHFCFPMHNTHAPTINGLAEAVKLVDYVTTVSEQYSREIQEEPAGKGLSHLFKKRAEEGKLRGILNGLDLEVWNPKTDTFLPCQYSRETLSFQSSKRPIQREKNLHSLVEQLGIEWRSDKPFVCAISRLTWQKGLDLLEEAFRWVIEQGGNCVCLGIAYDDKVREQMSRIDRDLRPYGCWLNQYDESLTHKIIGSADIFIMPSIFEPCGLTQMMALRYGCIPVVRHTGGLADTVFDFDFSNRPEKERNGFSFHHRNKDGILNGIGRAFDKWNQRDVWHKLIWQAMGFQRGWKEATHDFYQIYKNN